MSAGSAGADRVAVICGPTGAGKSEIALTLAAPAGRAIVAADSRQVFRRFDIGTAKPTAREQRSTRHFGVDLVEPTERFSAARWADVAGEALADFDAARRPIVVGGTGMYLRALFEGLFVDPTIDDDRRSAVFNWLDSQPTGTLRVWTSQLDQTRAHLGRTQLLRAVGVALLTGQRISRLHEMQSPRSRWQPRYLVVDPGPALHDRIARRLDDMLDAGWLDEVRALDDVPVGAPAWKAAGYRTLQSVIRGTMSLNEARERILIETRQYAKRQRTWFRHQLPDDRTTRVDPTHPDAEALVARWWDSIDAQ